MNTRPRKLLGIGTLCALGAAGCGGGTRSHTLPWDPDETTIIDADGQVRTVPAAEGAGCLEFGECLQPQLVCEGRAADVVVDRDGNLVETVCYPTGETLTVSQIASQDGVVAQNQNNAVIVLDDRDNGVDIGGELTVDANNVVVYGAGPDSSVIGGDVSVEGNNIIVRGVRIVGDVDIIANNAVFLHCVIEGNVSITGNNAVLAACDVFGELSVLGNNARISGNRVVGGLSISGQNTECAANYAAADTNEDGVLEASEVGAPLSCG